MRYLKWFLLLTIILLTTGCWNYRELNELSITGALGIDVKGNDFIVSAEVINTKKVANISSSGGNTTNEAPFVIYKASGKTIKEALINMTLETPNPIYIGHLNLFVISDEVARKGLNDFIDFVIAETESRKIFPTVVVKNGKAIDALKILTPLEIVTSANMKASLEAIANLSSIVSNRQFDNVIMCLYQEGRDPTISSIELVGDLEMGSYIDNLSYTIPKASMRVSGTAAFKGDKLVGYLNTKESLAYTIIRDHAQSMSLSFPCDNKGNYGNVIVDNVKNKLKVKIVNNKPVAEINVTGQAALPEINCDIDITTSKNLVKVKKMADKELKKIIDKTIKKVQKKFGGDIFGFGERLYKENNKYWEKNKKNWDKIFPNMNYKINVNIQLESTDSTIKTAKER